jgi:hypothetical protein
MRRYEDEYQVQATKLFENQIYLRVNSPPRMPRNTTELRIKGGHYRQSRHRRKTVLS